MAQAGTTFDKKYVYHGQLCQISPFVGQLSGYKKFRDDEPITVFFKVQGDAEGEYGVKMEEDCPGYEDAWKRICHDHREKWLTIACEGMAKEGKGVVTFTDLDGNVLASNAGATPQAQKPQGSAPAPAQSTNGVKSVFPYVSQEERFREALQVAHNLIARPAEPADRDLCLRLAVSMTISQEHIQRQIGQWIPLETTEDTHRQATEGEIEAIRILFGDVVLEVPARERKALEDLLARAPKITYGAVIKAADYLGRVAQERRDNEPEPVDDTPQEEPPQPGEPAGKQETMKLAGEDDLPF